MITNFHIDLYQTISKLNERRVPEHWHASSLAQCPRAQYFQRLGVEPINKPSAALQLRWDAGHHMESAIRPVLQEHYSDLVSNERITSKKLDLTGEYDNWSAEKKTIIEVKSVHDYAFKEKDGVLGLKEQIGTHENGNKKWGVKNDPYLHHEIQNHSYYLLLEKKPEKIIYVYLSLSGRVVTYETGIKEDLLKNVQNRLKTLNEAWEKQEPPVCICRPDHPLYGPVMQYCDYREGESCCSLSFNKVKEK